MFRAQSWSWCLGHPAGHCSGALATGPSLCVAGRQAPPATEVLAPCPLPLPLHIEALKSRPRPAGTAVAHSLGPLPCIWEPYFCRTCPKQHDAL